MPSSPANDIAWADGVLKAVLFDAVGTLFHVRGSVGAAYAAVAARHGVTVTAGDIERRFRTAFANMPPLCFPGVAAAELPQRERAWWRQVVTAAFAEQRFADFDRFFDDLFEHFARGEAWELFADTLPTFTALRGRGIRLGVVSNFDGRLVRVCEALNIDRYLDAIVMSARSGYAKPDPRIFAVALGRLGVGPAEAVHVGDSMTEDVEGARAAGLRAVLIDRQSDEGPRADCLRDLHDVLQYAVT